MGQILHGSATTTHAVRAAIQRPKATIGLRKAAQVEAAQVEAVESGASSKELQSLAAHRTLSMSEHYTKGAEKRKLAVTGARKVERARRHKNRK